MEEKKVVKLKHSIPIPKEGGGFANVVELEFGRLKVKHLRLLPDDFMSSEGKISPISIIALIAGIANIPVESADEIDIEDLASIAKEIESFLGGSLGTGKK